MARSTGHGYFPVVTPAGRDTPAPARPIVSIVIAVWNAVSTLERCLASIFAQGWPCEIIVIDGGSTDGSVAILETHAARLGYWRSGPDAGIYDAWNRALPHLAGEWVLFLGADDYFVAPDSLAALMACDDGQVSLISGRAALVTMEGRVRQVMGGPWDWEGMAREFSLAHSATLQRRSLFHQHGTFDASFRIAGDYDFLMRLPRETTAGFVDRVVVARGDEGVSVIDMPTGLRELFRVQRAHPRVGALQAWWHYFLVYSRYLIGYRLLPWITLGRFIRPRRPTNEILPPPTAG